MLLVPRHCEKICLKNILRRILGRYGIILLVSSCSQSGQQDGSTSDSTPIVKSATSNLPANTPGIPSEKPVIKPEDFLITSPPEYVNSLTPTAQWAEAPDDRDYDVIVSPSSSCKVPLQAYGDVSATEHPLTTLLEGTYYLCVYAIQIVGGKGELLEAHNSPYQFTVDITPPPAPTIDAVAAVTNNTTPEITWNLVDTADFYDLFVGSDENCVTIVQSWTNLTGSSQILTTLTDGTYYLCLNAKDKATNQTPATNTNLSFRIDTTKPTVMSLNSDQPDGSYRAGTSINIAVVFSESVWVDTTTGTPTLLLETGATDTAATYTSGSGTDTLIFSYVVAAGDTSADLDANGSIALVLNGGTIRDLGPNDAILTLPIATEAGSLAANKSLVIDTTKPNVSAITSTTPNGLYKAGDVITLTVSFDEPVYVTNSTDLKLPLETGAVDTDAIYTSGSGTNTLTFSYTVAINDVSADLSAGSAQQFTLGTATIKDLAGNNLVNSFPTVPAASTLGGSKNLVIDGIIPYVTNITSTTIDGPYKAGTVIPIQLTFSETVNLTNPSDLFLTVETGSTDQTAIYSSGNGSTVLTFNYTVHPGDTSADLELVSQVLSLGTAGAVKDIAGNNANTNMASATHLSANKNLVIDTTPPTVTLVDSATLDGYRRIGQSIAVRLTFSEPVFQSGVGPVVLMETGATDRNATYTSGSGSNTLIFDYTVVAGDQNADLDVQSANALTLGAGTLQDAAGNDAVLTLPIGVNPNSLSSMNAFVVDGIVPTITSVTSTTGDGIYKLGDVIAVQVNFSENVTLTSPGSIDLTMETGAIDRIASYAAGSGTNSITFNYTVQVGDTSADLDINNAIGITLNAGAIQDAAGNNADLTLNSTLAVNQNMVVDGIVPTISSITSSSGDGTYKIGDTIAIDVNFSESVHLTNPNSITLTVETGAIDRIASYASGDGTSTVTFSYTVQAGDASADLDTENIVGITLNGGAIKDAAGNDAVLTLNNTLATNQSIIVDGIVPTVTSVSSTTGDGTYKLGDTISIQVNFSENVTLTNAGSITLTLETGAIDCAVTYASGSGSSVITFDYVVQAGDISLDLDTNNAVGITLNGGSIKDTAGNNATLTLNSTLATNQNIVVDGIVPRVTSVTSSSGNGYFKAGDVVTVDVHFDDVVNVSDTAQLKLWFETGATDAYGVYASGNGSTNLVFNYTIQSGENSSDLATHPTLGLDLGTATIKDGSGNNADLDLSVSPLSSNQAIVVDTIAPTVTVIDSMDANGYRKIGDSVAVRVNFSETVVTTGTDQVLLMETGAIDRNATFANGSGTSALTFTYTVGVTDINSDLDVESASALSVGTGTIKDLAGNNAILTVPLGVDPNSLASQKSFQVDGVVPTVLSVTSSSGNGVKKIGDVVAVQVNFNENVTLTSSGSITLTMETGATDRLASYASGDGTSSITFNYTVQAGDVSADLDTNNAVGITLNGGTIKDAAGNDATLTLNNTLAGNQSVVVDGIAPTVTSVTSSSGNGYFKAGDVITVEVHFDDVVTVSDTAQLKLWFETGASDAYGVYSSGNSTATLTFSYTIQSGENSADLSTHPILGLEIGTATIRDGSGNDANTNLLVSPLSANQAIVVDTTPPTVTVIDSIDANGYRIVGESVAIRVNFSEAVVTTGTDQVLLLETGATDRNALFSSGSGTSALTFTYTVNAGDESTDLDAQSAAALSVGTGTIKDLAGNDAVLGVPVGVDAGSLASQKNFQVDGIVPTVVNVTSSSGNGTKKIGDIVAIQVNFSKNVNLTSAGSITLTLETGVVDRTASYVSGNGTSSITFNYTVQSGDVSADLDTHATGITLNGGTIKDAAGNNANLTLNNSLASNQSIVVDGVAPTVTSVTSPTGNGYYKVGGVIDVAVHFDDVVTVSNTSQLKLWFETGATDAYGTYLSGDGTANLTFRYTVQAGENSSDLATHPILGLDVGTATIKDGSGNDANLNLLASPLDANQAIVVDTTAPGGFSITGPTNPVYTGASTVTFGASAGASSYDLTVSLTNDCNNPSHVGGSPFTGITGNQGLTLDDGLYYLCMSSTDLAGNITQASNNPYAFEVETTVIHASYTYYDSGLGTYELRHVVRNAGNTTISAVDAQASSMLDRSSLSLDNADKVHVSYALFDGSHYNLRYGTNTSGSFSNELAEGGANADEVGGLSAIALESDNTVHMVFRHYTDDGLGSTSDQLQESTGTSGSLSSGAAIETLSGAGQFYHELALAVDSTNIPHLVYTYYDGSNYLMKYRNKSGGWTGGVNQSITNGSCTDISRVSIALSSSDKVHIAYLCVAPGGSCDLYYGTNSSGAWVHTLVDTVQAASCTGAGITASQRPSIVLDQNNKAYIGYINTDSSTLSYATNVSNSWVTTAVRASMGWNPLIVVDQFGKVYLQYLSNDSQNANLISSSNNSGSWVHTVLDNSGKVRSTGEAARSGNKGRSNR